MGFLEDKCIFEVLTKHVILESFPFTCGNDVDMDEFFQKDALVYAHRRLGKSYCCWSFHRGSFCQLSEGNPIERVCILGLSFRSLTNALVKSELGTMLCSIYAR